MHSFCCHCSNVTTHVYLSTSARIGGRFQASLSESLGMLFSTDLLVLLKSRITCANGKLDTFVYCSPCNVTSTVVPSITSSYQCFFSILSSEKSSNAPFLCIWETECDSTHSCSITTTLARCLAVTRCRIDFFGTIQESRWIEVVLDIYLFVFQRIS